jgi:hypothetical protein
LGCGLIFGSENGTMAIYENLRKFHDLPVKDFKQSGDIADLSTVAPRLRCHYDEDESLADYLSCLLDEPGALSIRALVLGVWMEGGEAIDTTPREAIELLVASKDKLPNLEALFVGDIISEENEISWIQNSDMSALWLAFPKLKEFGARGGNDLRLGKINHRALKKLVIETGGLPAALAREVLEANAPLEHLELWIGDDGYGRTTEISDLNDLFDDKLFPNLKTLALRNCDFADEVAVRLGTSPILERIEHLDLSLGTLTNAGAEALIASGRIGHLKSLDIRHHYVSDDVRKKLAAVTPNLIADDAEKPGDWDGEPHYYVSVSE